MNGRNVAASVRAKLLNKARAEKRDFTLVLTRYALERLLYRLSISTHADHFLLKGALLFHLQIFVRWMSMTAFASMPRASGPKKSARRPTTPVSA